MLNGTLYWKVSIITTDGRGLVSIDLVNAETGEVYSLEVRKRVSINDFYEFIENVALGKHEEDHGLGEQVNMTITDRIEYLKNKIENLQKELEDLYKELEALEELLQTNTSREG